MSQPTQDVLATRVNPYAAPVSDARLVRIDAAPPGPRPLRKHLATVLAALIVIGAMVAAGLAVWDIESIVGSGPFLAGASLALIGLALPRALRPLVTIAVATLLFALGCFLTIWTLQWSPSDAQQPIGRACVVFALLVQLGWAAIVVVQRAGSLEQTSDAGVAPDTDAPRQHADSA